MSKPRDDRQKDLLLPALDQIIDMGHPLVRLAALIDWKFLDDRFGSVCQTGPGQPGLPTRLVAGLFILKHMHNLSDEVLCARWIENPYYQYFCGELSFCHRLPFDRSSMTRWRQRLGEEQLVALIQESLSVAHKTGAIGPKDLERVAVDTTVQPKAVAHPTDARLMHRAIIKLVGLASATACRCARAICAWPSVPPSWSAAIPTPTSSNAPGASSSSCGHGLAGSSATSAARSMAMRCWKLASARCSV
jgi:IS5 family transposase